MKFSCRPSSFACFFVKAASRLAYLFLAGATLACLSDSSTPAQAEGLYLNIGERHGLDDVEAALIAKPVSVPDSERGASSGVPVVLHAASSAAIEKRKKAALHNDP